MKQIIQTFRCEMMPFFRDIIRWNFKGSLVYQIYLSILLLFMLLGFYAYSLQLKHGLVETGMNNIVSWGLYVSNFTFLVGIAAAAVILIVPGFIPSPMGDIIDYVPSWVEIGVTAGILAFGILIVSVLLKSAVIIDCRYHNTLIQRSGTCKS